MRFILLIIISIGAHASADFVRLFNTGGEPIYLTLPVGTEVSLKFDNVIKSVAIKSNIEPKLLSESIDSRWWLTATDFFEPTRVLVKDSLDKVIVFVVSSAAKPGEIVKYRVITEIKPANDVPSKPIHKGVDSSLTLVDLTRFAAQKFYAPDRLIKNIGLNRVPITRQKINLFDCQSQLACVNVTSMPLASWSDGVHYISAIEIKNLSANTLNLDPRALIGNFVSATFQFNRIGAAGSNTDTTVLYVVSDQSLDQSL